MVFLSDAASASKSRFGFTDYSSDAVHSDLLLKSASRENLLRSQALTVRSNADQEDGHHAVSSSQSFDFSEDPSFWKDHNVQVIIRLRPLNSSEISLQGYNKCVRQESCQTITWTGHPESRFTFDLVADENVSQENLFKVAGVPMVENCVGGYNSCMFAYGQTGSGKTHTMLGDIEGGTRRHSVNCGMTPRVFEYLFSRIQKEKEVRKDEKLRFTCRCSFLEIYNEQILDLLDPLSNNLQIREDNKKGVYVENLKEVEVTSAREVILQLIQGAANRKVAATNMNRASSRSHSVFTCAIESKWEVQGVTHHRFARLNLVDLAGSERQKSSGAEGERLKEATNINKSLSTLGLVIMNLVSISNGRSQHVPYRDSKLTFLLQDSLGGNSKTIIIANISPSSCCSLETLSTLKFAQRAKFIKNNAIVNEDASGDVISMRIQIQQLKKEVSRLRNLVNGADNVEGDVLSTNFVGSPGSCFKWEGLQGSFSPLTCDKRKSQKNDYEVALAGAVRRAKDQEIALQALASQNQAALQLAKQREDEIQGLKMRLRFREAGIKRLEAVASKKISAESHLLKEKEEHLKEIEVLRSQVDRNQEVTRFAMENLQLTEEIRRLKSFVEEGERERMNEQISVLEKKLLEALDWKLMHESNPPTAQKPASPQSSSVHDENEFLRLQAIQNQAELDRLRKKLDFCLEEKEKLERHANDLARKLEEERSSRAMDGSRQTDLPSSSTSMPIINFDDQMELKTMVDAIAAASQREAKAHGSAVVLSKENDELRMKLKVLIDDNNKLIELYEQATAERSDSYSNALNNTEEVTEMKRIVENLENQLGEMHEENEKLMSLYEKAMQERDDYKRMLYSGEAMAEAKAEEDCPEKLVEVDECEQLEAEELISGNDEANIQDGKSIDCLEASMEETDDERHNVQDGECDSTEKLVEVDGGDPLESEDLLLSRANTEDTQVIKSQDYLETSVDDTGDLRPSLELSDCFMEADPPSSAEVKKTMEETAQLMKPFLFDESEILKKENGNFELSAEPESRQFSKDHHASSDGYEETELSDLPSAQVPQEIGLVKTNLENVELKLKDTAKTIAVFGSVEKAVTEVDELLSQIEERGRTIEIQQNEVELLKTIASEAGERADLTFKKFAALKHSLFNFSSSVDYFEQREARARGRVCAASSYLDQKKNVLSGLQARKDELEVIQVKNQKIEEETKKKLVCLREKLEEEKRKQESEKVLFAIENVVEKPDPSKNNWHLGGKASDLLKSEEEKIKLQTEISLCQERLGIVRKELGDLKQEQHKLDVEIRAAEVDVGKGLKSVGEMEIALSGVIGEKNSILEMRENGLNECESVFFTYHQHVFEADLKDEEVKLLEEELQSELRRVKELQRVRTDASQKKSQVLQKMRTSFCKPASITEELQSAVAMIEEARSWLNN